MKQILFCLLIFFLLPFSGFTQNLDSEDSSDLSSDTADSNTQGPFVSKIKAQTQDSLILLTWETPENFQGTIMVYRYTDQISNNNFLLAKELAQLDDSKISYVDFPQNSLGYFYAILLKDENDIIYYNYIPFRNITTTAVSIIPEEESIETEAKITGIQAQVINDYITITWQTSQKKRDLMIFRSTKAINSADDLLGSVSPQPLDGGTESYSDAAIPGIDYYYAVLDANQFKIGKISFTPDENATSRAVTIPLLTQESESTHENFVSQRSRPLPILSITKDVEFDQSLITSPTVLLPRKTELSGKTKSAVAQIVNSIQDPGEPQMEFQVLDLDMVAESRGSANTLYKIITGKLNLSGMDTALLDLIDFLKVRQSAEIEARAGFYLGQIYYFKGDYQNAILNFIQANDLFYLEVQPWMDACFYQLVEQEKQ